MTEPQTWALLGIFTTIMLGGMTLMTTLLTRTFNAAIGGLRGEMNARFEAVNAKFDAVNAKFDAKFDAVDAKFDAVNARIDHMQQKMDTRFETLDRDIAALTKRVMD
ncbi:hypothetical protein ET475_02725 [Microbacterium protaetiae]|uniref:Uncharacterized protein n=1 Tax=Microbacterium protaetiae TaxID=2509458 RepID=A0A4P6ECE4_9MICO|nr:hypothetical protein [Microbacterium protaetiae]QAY59013.1 hypothetical protein ET475_02725 [Microbacterium protaetiae]